MHQMTRVFLLSIMCLVVYSSCTQETKDVVAHVGDRTITATQLLAYIDMLPEKARIDTTDIDEIRHHLLTMIDMELMLLEASSMGIDKSLEFLKKMAKSQKLKLVDLYQQRMINISAEEQEMLAYIKDKGYDRALRLADIMVLDKDKADAVRAEIKAGKNFADVAKRWSLNQETAAKGGDMGKYVFRESMIPLLRDHLYALAIGEVSEPIQIGNRYALFKLLDMAPVEINPQLGMKIQKEYHQMKFNLEKTALVKKLKSEFLFQPSQDGFDILIEALRQRKSFTTAEERNTILYSYGQHKITAGDFVDAASYFKGNVLANLTESKQAQAIAEKKIVPNILIMNAALDAKIDKEEKVAKWLVDQERQLLVMELRKTLLAAKVTISEDEVRQYYDTHPQKYLHPEHIEIQEVLVSTRPEAIGLIEEIHQGALLGNLAREHSIRPLDFRDEDGRFHIHLYEKKQFGDLVDVAAEAELGTLMGPVKVEEGYSIFKALSRGRKQESYDEANRRVRSHVTKEKNRQAFNLFIEGLRQKHAPTVKIQENNLMALEI